jgi:anti-sigma factor RsiW
MDDVMKENLEAHLSGMLAGEGKRDFEAYLAKHPKAADELAEMEESSALFEALGLDEEDEMLAQPASGFYGRVMREVEEERSEPFWMVFLEPFLIRRLAFASLMWLAILGSYIVVAQSPNTTDPQMVTRILMEPQEYKVRLGGDLDKNRNSMLSVMLASR